MADLARLRVSWSGAPVVGEGVSTFYFAPEHDGFVADVHEFFTTIRTAFPSGITWTIPGNGDLIDVASGELSGTWVGLGPMTQTGGGVTTYALGVGARAVWGTTGIRSGRRVKGSTFLCPLVTAAYQSDGTIDASVLTVLNGACADLLTESEGNMRIYSRPKALLPGQANTVVAGSVKDAVSWLRSRRT